jgi:hypothetical protein
MPLWPQMHGDEPTGTMALADFLNLLALLGVGKPATFAVRRGDDPSSEAVWIVHGEWCGRRRGRSPSEMDP